MLGEKQKRKWAQEACGLMRGSLFKRIGLEENTSLRALKKLRLVFFAKVPMNVDADVKQQEVVVERFYLSQSLR